MLEETQLELEQFTHSKTLQEIFNLGEVVYDNFPIIISKCRKYTDEDSNSINQVVKESVHSAHLTSINNNFCSKHCINLRNEYNIVSQFNHPNIISPIGNFQSSDQGCSIIFPQASCDAFTYFLTQNYIPSFNLIKIYLYQMASALCYLHEEKQTCHNDYKLENVLVYNQQEDPQFILTDFGNSNQLDETKQSQLKQKEVFSSCRVTIYQSPSIQQHVDNQQYSKINQKQGDVFSFGYTLFLIIFRRYLFDQESIIQKTNKLQQISQEGSSYFLQFTPVIQMNSIQQEDLFDLLSKMLNPIDENRISSSEILSHPLFSE